MSDAINRGANARPRLGSRALAVGSGRAVTRRTNKGLSTASRAQVSE
jgi:hypothetical protein